MRDNHRDAEGTERGAWPGPGYFVVDWFGTDAEVFGPGWVAPMWWPSRLGRGRWCGVGELGGVLWQRGQIYRIFVDGVGFEVGLMMSGTDEMRVVDVLSGTVVSRRALGTGHPLTYHHEQVLRSAVERLQLVLGAAGMRAAQWRAGERIAERREQARGLAGVGA